MKNNSSSNIWYAYNWLSFFATCVKFIVVIPEYYTGKNPTNYMEGHIPCFFAFLAYVQEIRDELFSTEAETLYKIFQKYEKEVPEPLSSPFENQLSKAEAVAKWQTRQSTHVMMLPPGKREYTVL